jgi:hypothetical protein
MKDSMAVAKHFAELPRTFTIKTQLSKEGDAPSAAQMQWVEVGELTTRFKKAQSAEREEINTLQSRTQFLEGQLVALQKEMELLRNQRHSSANGESCISDDRCTRG